MLLCQFSLRIPTLTKLRREVCHMHSPLRKKDILPSPIDYNAPGRSHLANADSPSYLTLARPLCDAPLGSCGHEIVNHAIELDAPPCIPSLGSHCTSFGYRFRHHFPSVHVPAQTAVKRFPSKQTVTSCPLPSIRGICFMNGTACSPKWQFCRRFSNPLTPRLAVNPSSSSQKNNF